MHSAVDGVYERVGEMHTSGHVYPYVWGHTTVYEVDSCNGVKPGLPHDLIQSILKLTEPIATQITVLPLHGPSRLFKGRCSKDHSEIELASSQPPYHAVSNSSQPSCQSHSALPPSHPYTPQATPSLSETNTNHRSYKPDNRSPSCRAPNDLSLA
jgi:hypothetical protein